MHAHEKLNLIARLVPLGQDYPSIEGEVVALILKAASPPVQAQTGKPVGVPSSKQPVSPTLDELCFARAVGKIPAIKAYRTRTGFGLKESKDAIEKGLTALGWFAHGTDYYQNPGHPTHIFEDIEPIPF